MTDLERAAEIVDAMGREIGGDKVFWPETWRRKIQAALNVIRLESAARAAEKAYANGFRRGAEEMRERAAQAVLKTGGKDAGHYYAVVRALPLTPEEPT